MLNADPSKVSQRAKKRGLIQVTCPTSYGCLVKAVWTCETAQAV